MYTVSNVNIPATIAIFGDIEAASLGFFRGFETKEKYSDGTFSDVAKTPLAMLIHRFLSGPCRPCDKHPKPP
jgi:hypothetical protein